MGKEIKIKSKTDEQWGKYLLTPWNNISKAAIEFAKRMHEFRESCEAGDGDFTRQSLLWFGLNKDASSDWSLIGAQYDGLVSEGRILPGSRKALKKLSLLSLEELELLEEEGVLNSSLSASGIDSFMERMKVREEMADFPEANEKSDPVESIIPPEDEAIDGEYTEIEDDKDLQVQDPDPEPKEKKKKEPPEYTIEDAYEILQGVPYTREVLLLLKKHAVENEVDELELDKAVSKIIEAQFS